MSDNLVDRRLRYIDRQRQLHADTVNVDVRRFVPLGSGPRIGTGCRSCLSASTW